jgi:tetrahydromethanopterin S-methyltransferase subunit G
MDKGKFKKMQGAMKPPHNDLFKVNYDISYLNKIIEKLDSIEHKVDLLNEENAHLKEVIELIAQKKSK